MKSLSTLFDRGPVVISGGDGFLGQALTRRLVSLGARVCVIDNHVTSVPGPRLPGVQRWNCDVSDVEIGDLPTASLVLHLASVAIPGEFGKYANSIMRANTDGTRRMLALARRDSARFVFASTSEVYGDAIEAIDEHRGIHESDLCTSRLLTGRSVYSTAKRMGEEWVAQARLEGADATSIRIFNVYGPGMDPLHVGEGRVVPNFLHCAKAGLPLPIHGDGSQIRSFLWIEDFVDAVLSILTYEGPLPDVLNVGVDEPVTIRRLAELVESACGVECRRHYTQRPGHDPDWRRPNASRLTELTGWQSTTSLAEGLRRLAAPEPDLSASDPSATKEPGTAAE